MRLVSPGSNTPNTRFDIFQIFNLDLYPSINIFYSRTFNTSKLSFESGRVIQFFFVMVFFLSSMFSLNSFPPNPLL